ncbi:MAG: DUF6516 family protein [candidate division KSB1 bacterium]|nr:DUF6516 family protein [candidate division KSB1 bacterium]
MSLMDRLLSEILVQLTDSPACLSAEVIELTTLPNGNFVIKIRARLKKSCHFQVRLYYSNGHYDYSYQLYNQGTIARWDNKEDFPHLPTFPHHFHTENGAVIESLLSGDPLRDFPVVLREVERIIALRDVN